MTTIFTTNQFLVIGLFLIVLVGLMMLVRRYKDPLASQLGGQRRVRLVEDTAIGSNERIKLVTIDGAHYAVITSKNQQPVILTLDQAEARDGKDVSHPKPEKADKAKTTSSQSSDTIAQPFLQAMKRARSRNPLLGFDK